MKYLTLATLILVLASLNIPAAAFDYDPSLPQLIKVKWDSYDPQLHAPPGGTHQGFVVSFVAPGVILGPDYLTDDSTPCSMHESLYVSDPDARSVVVDIWKDLREECLFPEQFALAHITVTPYADDAHIDAMFAEGIFMSWFVHPPILLWGADLNTNGSVNQAAEFLEFSGCFFQPADPDCVLSDMNGSGTVDSSDFILFSQWMNWAIGNSGLPVPYCFVLEQCE